LDHSYYHALAISLDREGRIEEALSAIEEALRFNPDGAQILSTYAHLLTTAGKFDEAEDAIGRRWRSIGRTGIFIIFWRTCCKGEARS
jgi:Flp pilus assembly protein TadD